MTINSVFDFIVNNGGWAILLFICSFIEIPKLKLNIWQILINEINKPVLKRIEELSKESRAGDDALSNQLEELDTKLEQHIEHSDEARAKKSRERIVIFNEELLRGANPSGDRWADIILEIDSYVNYCDTHPNFSNGVCITSIENIKELNKKRIINTCEENKK